MSDLILPQMRLQHQIERALENYRKIGRNNLTPAKIRSRLATLKEVWTAYQHGHDKLTQATPTEDQPSTAYFKNRCFERTEEIYSATRDHLMEDLEELEPIVSPTKSLDTSNARFDPSAHSFNHLPKIRLPPFDGNYSDWESFRDRFTALIIENKEITNFSRMHYLSSSLKGRALECIGNISITADNFPVAWVALKARFENKRRLLASHLSTLLGLSAVSKESVSDLQLLCDKVSIATESLKNLDRTPSDLWDDLLVHLILQKVDSATRKAWTLKNSDADQPPTYEELKRFLGSRVRALEEASLSASSPSKTTTPSSSRVHVATAASNSQSACPLCKARHYLNACPTFIAQNTNQRRETVKKFKRCFNCLSMSHSASSCRSKYSCRSCNKKHHSMLHADSDPAAVSAATASVAASDNSQSDPTTEVNALLASAKSCVRSRVLLATALVKLKVPSGRSVTVRALLDQGSEATFLSENIAQLLRVKRFRMPTSISAVGGHNVGTVRHAASIQISARNSDTPSVNTTALILPSLTSYTSALTSDLSSLSHLTDLAWADPAPNSSDPIQIILGADIYSDLILDGVRKGQRGAPAAQNSILGWVISGPVENRSIACAHSVCHTHSATRKSAFSLSVNHCAKSASLAEEIRRFWEIEEIPHTQNLTPLDEQCMAHFRDTHSRQPDGRYVVRLPFKQGPPIHIGHSRNAAERTFNSLLRRFRTNAELEEEYREFMREYEELGHMRRAPADQDLSNQCVYIPHHAVFREGSATTRIRVVFNASSVTSNGSSLNEHLLAGPKLQADLPAIILKWRQHKFVCTADVAKMYRQIAIDNRDVDYQRILWKNEPASDPLVYQLLTVTYGLTCSAFLALIVFRQLAQDEGHRFPLATPILLDQIYVDDTLFGGDTVEEVRMIRDQLVSLLRCGKFELRKWASNTPALLADIDPSNHGLACDKNIATDEKIKVLGIVWNPARDIFQIKIHPLASPPRSKRAILSAIARLYDPLGWVTPVIAAAKIFMQQLWRSKLEWDSVLPGSLLSQWNQMYSQLSRLDEVQIARWTGSKANNLRMELHGFADASTLAYAAAVYLKVVSASGKITVSLLTSKSKVAPINPLTVPRLELSAALLLVRLLTSVRSALNSDSAPCVCWTDSTIVLSWLGSHPSRWKTFVSNRVHEIQSRLPDAVWRHVPTSDNPADCASRGLLGGDLVNHPLWWRGPPWLQGPSDSWPPAPPLQAAPPEEKITTLHVTAPPPPGSLYAAAPGTALSAQECNRARTFWIKRIQADLFTEDISRLAKNQSVKSKSAIASLNPHLDADGVLRVGGRLRNAPIHPRVRHPVILASHPLVRLIIEHAHLRTLHGGTQLTLRTLRQDFWVLRARSLTKTVIHNCVICVRERAATPTQLMGNLPVARVSPPPRSFTHCGLDYAGPVQIRASAGRGIASRKAYIALFVCLATRAIHLELVGDYSTPSFLNAYTRFCSRRGLPRTIYSDNGTTFVGADKELTNAYRSSLRDPNFLNKTACDGVSWKFIPPSAPHFGGLWEAGVRSVKHHLRRILGGHTLSFEEFTTFLCKIEACLNSRPIAPLSDSIEDYDSLTPGHFLIGSALTVAPEPSLLNLNENRLSRWQVIRHIAERFWKIWSNDYINTLQQRSKWRKPQPSAKIGQLVLLRNDSLPPCKWDLGRITRTHPGSDGLTRVVTVKTATAEYKRPLVKLCLLPIDKANRAE